MLLVLLAVAGTLFIPPLLRPRLTANENAAEQMVAMHLSAQRAFRQESGRWAAQGELLQPPPGGPKGGAWLPLLSERVVALRANDPAQAPKQLCAKRHGYLIFLEEEDGLPVAVWAEPIEPGYSGNRSFRGDLLTGRIEAHKAKRP